VNARQRMMATFENRRTDRIPVHHISFSADAAATILGREAIVGGAFVQWREMQALYAGLDAHAEFDARRRQDAVAIAEACGHDLLRPAYWRWPTDEVPTQRVDDWTFLFGDPDGKWYTMTYDPAVELLTRRNGPGVAGAAAAEPTEEALARQVADEEDRAAQYHPGDGPDPAVAELVARHPDYALKVGTETVFVSMLEPPQLAAAALWPELFARLLMARARRYAKDVARLGAAGATLNFAGMDFCSKDGPTVSPALFKRVVLPALKVLVDATHACGLKYVYGSDGNFWPVAELMFEAAGVDGWFEVDRSAGMDLRALRRRFPQVTLIGNIPVQVLHRGTVADVERETMECLDAAGEVGGIVVGVSNMIMPGTRAENIEIMLRLIDRHR